MILMRDIEQILRMAWLVLADLDLRVTLTDWYHLAGDLEEFVYFAVDCVDM